MLSFEIFVLASNGMFHVNPSQFVGSIARHGAVSRETVEMTHGF